MTEIDIDSLQRQSRLVKPSRYPSLYPEGADLIRAGLAGGTAGILIALLVCFFVYLYAE